MSAGPNRNGGLCHCGCGNAAPLASQTDHRHGYVKGQPVRFLKGHSNSHAEHPYVIDARTGCWVWQAGLTQGYGRIRRPSVLDPNRIVRHAHRWYYERAKGAIPEGLELDHLCRNRACVNPDHLEAVTRAENVRRGLIAKLGIERVREIRESPERSSVLALHYGVTKHSINNIRAGRTWRDAA